MRAAVFTDAAQLLQALLTTGRALPGVVHRLAEGGWAVQAQQLGWESEDDLVELGRQYGWSMSLNDLDMPEPTSIFEMLSGAWTYRDPLHGRPWSDALGDSGVAGGADASYDLTDRETEHHYLLAARDPAQSQQILDLLGSRLVDRVVGAPVLMRSVRGECPFQFFWLVRWRLPDPFVLERAARVWWGPVTHGDPPIFLQWPRSLALPVAALRLLPWGADAAYVLLSQDAPHHLILRRRAEGPVLHEIEELARLSTAPARVGEATPGDPPHRPALTVRIRLTEGDPRAALANRVNELKREIEAKQLIYEQVAQRLESDEPVVVALEPLVLYGERPGAPGEIPLDLRRLLIEWADLDADLRSLYYVSLDASQLPAGRFLPGRVHVVTTGTALGKKETGQVGVRLWEYTADAYCLGLRAEWAEFGVRIFTPHRQYTELYPNMRPGRVGAARLAEALLPGDDPQAATAWIALLLPDQAGVLHVVRLRIDDFTPLSDAWRWSCRAAVALDEPAVVRVVADRMWPEAWTSASESFRDSVEQEAQRRIDALLPPIVSDIGLLDGELRTLRSDVEAQGTRIAGLREPAASLAETVADCAQAAAEMRAAIERISRHAASAARSAAAAAELLAAIARTKEAVVTLQARIDALDGGSARPAARRTR